MGRLGCANHLRRGAYAFPSNGCWRARISVNRTHSLVRLTCTWYQRFCTHGRLTGLENGCVLLVHSAGVAAGYICSIAHQDSMTCERTCLTKLPCDLLWILLALQPSWLLFRRLSDRQRSLVECSHVLRRTQILTTCSNERAIQFLPNKCSDTGAYSGAHRS